MANGDTTTARRTIQTWKESLTDFSARNPLLFYKPTKTGSLQLTNEPDALFDRLVSEKKVPISELAPLAPRDADASVPDDRPTVEAICTKLRRRAKTFQEESGFSPLTLAFGYCEWDSPNGPTKQTNGAARQCRAPVVLMPVELHRQSAHSSTILSYEGGEIVINPVLRRALQRDLGLATPDDPEEAQTSLTAIMERLRDVQSDQHLRFTPGLVLGLFSFSRLVMVDDLERNEARILAHPVLSALLGVRGLPNDGPALNPRDLDAYFATHHGLSVIDADSSQQVAIEAAKAGKSLVIQGPPGTGKSQTITNIIAELVADGKRVLFVSAKRAALDVVLQRMKSVGLDDLCLNAHDDGVDKKRVIADLYQTYESALAYHASPPGDSSRQEKLCRDRKTLNDHVEQLHMRHDDMEMSVFQAYEALCAEADRPMLPLAVHDAALFTTALRDRLVDAVERVTAHADLATGNTQSLWHVTTLAGSLSYNRQMEITGWFNTLDAGISKIMDATREIASLTGITVADLRTSSVRWVLDIAESLATAPTVESAWLKGGQEHVLQNQAQTLAQEIGAYQRDHDATLSHYSGEVFALDLDDLRARLEGPYASPLKRLLNRQYRQDRATLAALRGGTRPSYAEMRVDVDVALAARERKAKLDGDAEARRLFGHRYQGTATDIAELGQSVGWAMHFLSLVAGKADPAAVYASATHGDLAAGRLERLSSEAAAALSEVEDAKRQVRALFPTSTLRDWDGDTDLSIAQDVARRLRSELPLLLDWLAYQEARTQLEKTGFPNLIDQFKGAGLPVEDWGGAFRRGFINAWIEYQYARQPALGSFRHTAHERVVDEFRTLDTDAIAHAQQVIRAAHARSVQEFQAGDETKQSNRLASEAMKKRQVWSIRKLLSQIPELLLQVKPCWMMSPLSVTQMVNADRVHFDTVIFDEASQVRAEEAVSAILRANQVIVVGDDKQLPPTSFFDVSLQDDGDDDTEPDAFESILDQCAVHLQRYMLRWHYRSRDETLIAFSNQTYYHNQLVTFPNADRREASGVSFRFVADAAYDRGGSRTNRKETQVVAEMICEHYRDGTRGSLGVIALSQAQQAAIEDALDAELRNRPDLNVPENGMDALFIKNLETVQGDERDVIFLSIGYGKTDAGVLNLNFGPINKQGGGRRLNVAITRARQALVVVSSIRADDIDTRRTSSEAMRQLRDYLAFAESDGQRLDRTVFTGPARFDSPFEEDVFHMLADRGHYVHSQVGCSQYRIDLAIVDPSRPGRYVLGIECDGATYHSSPTARDRDRLRQNVLEGLGWTIHRIWSRDWMRDKAAEIERVEQRLREMQAAESTDARILRMHSCPQCGQAVRPTARFCGHCRAEVASA